MQPTAPEELGVRAKVIELHGKRVFVLNGFSSPENDLHAHAVERLREAIEEEPDAVAFGCLDGKWVAAA